MPTFDDIVQKLKELKTGPFVKTHRTGNTGIGKTIEDLLGIEENNIPGPDTKDLELKSGRKHTTSMLTLFTKSPLPPRANSILLQRFGYPSRKGNGQKDLHTTVSTVSFNTLKGKTGFKIIIKHDRVELVDEHSEVLGYWDKGTLKERFENKYPGLLYVKAENRGRGSDEEFLFDEAWVLHGFDFENFVKLMRDGDILTDIRIGQYPDGRPHDHGTGFRVNPNKLDMCFSKRERII